MERMGLMRIHAPRIERLDGKCRLVAAIDTPEYGAGVDLWFAVDDKYGSYLCDERSDAFLVGMLFYAMRRGLDIECEAPVSEEILYNIRTYLIPSLSKHCEEIYACKISAGIATDPLPNAHAVGAGISCGIDSLHVLCKHADCEYKDMRLTHLVLNNVGAYKEGSSQFKWQLQHAREFCRATGFELIETDSNYTDAFYMNHKWFKWTNTYANAFCVLALQKFWGTFYIGSHGLDFSYFTLSLITKDDSAFYDLLFLNVVSTRWLRFHSEGGALSRYEKTVDVASYPPARKFLHVCTNDNGPNCNTCEKCIRTLLTLDAIGALDDFAEVFNVKYYRENRSFYLKWLYFICLYKGNSSYLKETYEKLSHEITVPMKVVVRMDLLRRKLAKIGWLKRLFRSVVKPSAAKGTVKREHFGSLPPVE